jgi:glycosyltransferase involved in cell wall biosynthesis
MVKLDKSWQSISVVIPVYRSALSIGQLTEEILHELRPLCHSTQIICVDDSSPDDSWRELQRLAAKHPEIMAITHTKNFGQHSALLTGFRYATGDVVLTMDDDLQHPAGEIPRLLAALTPEIDVVYGIPDKEQHGLWRDLSSVYAKFLLTVVLRIPTAKDTSAFRAIRGHLVRAFKDYRSPFVDIDAILAWGTRRFDSTVVRIDPRPHGSSNYTFRRLVSHAINMILNFTTLPLRIATFIGFFFMAFGVVILGYVWIVTWIFGRVVPGFALISSITAIFSGAQLFALGILGEYLAKLYIRAMDQPTGLIRCIINPPSEK